MGLATKAGLLLLRRGLVFGGTVYSVCKGGLPFTTIAATMPQNTLSK